MSLEILKSIEQAEGRAEEIRAQAQREARDMIKASEEASVQNERSAALEQRGVVQAILDDARRAAEKRIASMAQEEEAACQAVAEAARKHLDAAANLIFERVVENGHR